MSGQKAVTSREAGRKLERRRELLRLQRDSDLKKLMSMPEGRRFVWRLFNDIAGVHGLSFTGSSETFFREGRRSVGLELMKEAQRVCPTEWLSAMSEALRSQQEDELQRLEAAGSAETEDER